MEKDFEVVVAGWMASSRGPSSVSQAAEPLCLWYVGRFAHATLPSWNQNYRRDEDEAGETERKKDVLDIKYKNEEKP